MKKSVKRILCLILCLCMVASTGLVSVAAELPKVGGFAVTSFEDRRIDLKWNAVADAKGYEIERQKDGSDEWTRLKRQEDTTYADKAVAAGTVYNYRVRAYKMTGVLNLQRAYGDYSDTIKVATKPSDVTNLKGEATGGTSIKLTWKKADGAERYAIYMYNDKSKDYDKVDTTDKLSYEVKGLTESTEYFFKVKAYHKLNGTIDSEFAKISVSTPIGDVKNFRLVECTENSYKIAWDKTKNVVGYEIYKLNIKTGDYDLFRTTSTKSYYFKNISENYNTLYKIRAYAYSGDEKIYGVFSKPIAVGTKPQAPVDLDGAINTDNGVSLIWTDIPGVEGYEIYRYALLDEKWEKIGVSDEAYFTDKLIENVNVYRYRVTAYKGEGDNIFRSEMSEAINLLYTPAEEPDSIYDNSVLKQVGLIGYLYDARYKCFYTAEDPWQRNFGYNEIYDFGAGIVQMFIETLRLKFDYDNKNWMIQVWKGQYGWVLIGAEIGIYHKPADRVVEHYDCVPDEDRLRMAMTLEKLDVTTGEWTTVFHRPYGTYWWITGFVFGNEIGGFDIMNAGATIDNLRVDCRITMKDYKMLAGVTQALEENDQYYTTKGLDVFFKFRHGV